MMNIIIKKKLLKSLGVGLVAGLVAGVFASVFAGGSTYGEITPVHADVPAVRTSALLLIEAVCSIASVIAPLACLYEIYKRILNSEA